MSHTVHAGFSLVAPLRPGAEDATRAVLARMRASADTIFAGSETTHFLTGAVLPEQERSGKKLPATLLFLTSYWGPQRAHLEELVAVAGTELRELFAHCQRYPEREPCSDADLTWFMKRHRRPDTYYSGMNHVTHREVTEEHKLREAIEEFVDAQQAADRFAGLDEHQIRARIQGFVRTRPDLAWAEQPWTMTFKDAVVQHRHVILVAVIAAVLFYATLGWWLSRSSVLGVAAGAGWITGGIGLVLLLVMAGSVLFYEKYRDRYVDGRPPDDRVRAIAMTQLNPVINEMTVAGPIKEGFWRPMFLRVALWIAARYVSTAGISIPTVATARWLATDGGRRLIFISNFTNMSEPYVRDFIDVKNGAKRINLLFGQGHGYPTTSMVINRGAVEDSNAFIHVVNTKQHLTELWYCPYRNLSIDNIVINRKIRQGLFAPCSHQQARDWLKLL